MQSSKGAARCGGEGELEGAERLEGYARMLDTLGLVMGLTVVGTNTFTHWVRRYPRKSDTAAALPLAAHFSRLFISPAPARLIAF